MVGLAGSVRLQMRVPVGIFYDFGCIWGPYWDAFRIHFDDFFVIGTTLDAPGGAGMDFCRFGVDLGSLLECSLETFW